MSLLIGAALLLGLAGSARADEPQRDDFAYQVPIEITEPGSVYRAPLTVHVYQGVTRQDLGDLRVYNGAGEVVPHGIMRPDAEPAKNITALPVFPVPVRTPGASGDVSMFVATGAAGSIIALKTGTPSESEHSDYVLDASQTNDPIAALDVTWGEAVPEEQFIATLVIQASEDLKSWRTISQGVLASLRHEDRLLEQKRIAIPPQRAKYLRLSWAETQTKVSIKAVTAELRPKAEPERDWLALSGGKGEADREEYRFELSGRMPIDRARVRLPMNSVARVIVLSRNRVGDPWVSRGEKTVFALESGGRIVQDNEVALRGISSDEQWLLRLQGGANGTAEPVLELGWVPHELVFIARGSAPFTLGYGQARVSAAGNYGIEELIRRSKRDDAERVQILSAKLGAPTALRGDLVRTRPWYSPWQQWLLWTVLVLGVAVLALLAVRLSRQIGRLSE